MTEALSPLDQSVDALHEVLKNSEERRNDANQAYLLAKAILKEDRKSVPTFVGPREIGSYDEEPYVYTHYSRGIRYVDTSHVEVNAGEETYHIFLRETMENSAHERYAHRNENKPGISMLAVAAGDEKRARLLFSFEEERTVGYDGLSLDMLGTQRALETLQDFNTRLEGQKAEGSSVTASN